MIKWYEKNGAHKTKICVTSNLSGKETTCDLSITFDDFLRGLSSFNKGSKPVQECFPTLNRHERELILTGVGVEEWEDMFGEEE